MEPEELKRALRELGARLEAQGEGINALKQAQVGASLDGLGWALGFEILSNAVALLLLGNFLAGHWRDPWCLVSCVVLQAAAVLFLALGIRQVILKNEVDPAAPVLVNQANLARLRGLRVTACRWALLASPLLWPALAIVVGRGVFGFDVPGRLGPAWVAANVGFGALALGLGAWASRAFEGRPALSPWIKAAGDHLAGRSIAEASRRLDEIARFEHQ